MQYWVGTCWGSHSRVQCIVLYPMRGSPLEYVRDFLGVAELDGETPDAMGVAGVSPSTLAPQPIGPERLAAAHPHFWVMVW